MEGLGTAAALINVTQLTGKIIAILYDYQRSSRHALQEISAVKRALQELRDILEILEGLSAPSPGSHELECFKHIGGPLRICHLELNSLEAKLSSNSKLLDRLGSSLTWPLKETEVQKSLNILAGQRSNLHLALTADQALVVDINDMFNRYVEYSDALPVRSSIIQEMITNCRSLPDSAPAYFYFDFRELRKRTVDGCLRSLISQLVSRKDYHSPSLHGLHERCERGRMQPTTELLLSTLRDILQDIPETFIILDALDECGEVEHLLASISELLSRTTTDLHMLFTSCHQTQIAEAFRWAACQLETLEKCIKPAALRQALKRLPRTLNETYERMLGGIDKEHIGDVLKILQWLLYSQRPLRLKELAEVLAIDDDLHSFRPENCLRHPTDLLRICSSLVSHYPFDDQSATSTTILDTEIRLAHSTVREYLLSRPSLTGEVNTSCLGELQAQGMMAKSCLAYLLHSKGAHCKQHVDMVVKIDEESKCVDEDFPFRTYAARYWLTHAIPTDNASQELVKLLFTDYHAFGQWLHLYDPDGRGKRIWSHINPLNPLALAIPGKPLYYASLLGFVNVVVALLERGTGTELFEGFYGSAIGAAAAQGHADILKILLDHGLGHSLQGLDQSAGFFENPLYAVVYNGFPDCTRLLIEAGIDINGHSSSTTMRGAHGRDAPILVAAERGHLDVARVLVEQGANLSVTGHYGNVVESAAKNKHADVALYLQSRVLTPMEPGRSAPQPRTGY
ncbi:MAG: hypothetical protein Q9221_003429 [Calogaya cf. arnoldii]